MAVSGLTGHTLSSRVPDRPGSGSGKPEAETLARAAQEEMVVGVLVIGLDDIVVDILYADLGLHPIQVRGFELQHHQCTGGVLRQRLVDANPDFLTGRLKHPLRKKAPCLLRLRLRRLTSRNCDARSFTIIVL